MHSIPLVTNPDQALDVETEDSFSVDVSGMSQLPGLNIASQR